MILPIGRQDLSERSQRLRERQELLASANKAITFNLAANLEIEKQRYGLGPFGSKMITDMYT